MASNKDSSSADSQEIQKQDPSFSNPDPASTQGTNFSDSASNPISDREPKPAISNGLTILQDPDSDAEKQPIPFFSQGGPSTEPPIERVESNERQTGVRRRITASKTSGPTEQHFESTGTTFPDSGRVGEMVTGFESPIKKTSPPLPIIKAERIQCLRKQLKTPWRDSFKESSEVEEILTLCNELTREGECPPICVRCGKVSKKLINSHIIPNNILKNIRDVHCNGELNFMHDITGDVQKANDYTYILLCGICEKVLDIREKCPTCKQNRGKCNCKKDDFESDFEKSLGRLHLLLLADETDATINKEHWLARILAEIMLRGVFVISCLDTLLSIYRAEVNSLWEFATGVSTTCDIQLFLLPKHPIEEGSPLELVLRAPQQTELVNKKGCGNFLYTHFDFFHIILPLDELSTKYFKEYSPDDIHTVGTKVFNWRNYPSIIARNEEFAFDSSGVLRKTFPEVLVRVNADRFFCSLPQERQTGSPLQIAFSEKEKLSGKNSRLIVETSVYTDKETRKRVNTKPQSIYPARKKGEHDKTTIERSFSRVRLVEAAALRSPLAKYFPGLMGKLIREREEKSQEKEKRTIAEQNLLKMINRDIELSDKVKQLTEEIKKSNNKLSWAVIITFLTTISLFLIFGGIYILILHYKSSTSR